MFNCASVCATRLFLRHRLLVVVALLASACSSSEAAAPVREPPGKPGSHLWVEDSVSLELRYSYFFDTWGPNAPPPRSGASCWTLTRDALTAEQQAKLEAIVLVPLTAGCPTDGYSYHELTVADADGNAARYRDTGCDHLKVEGAEALLPQSAFDDFPFPDATDCAD
jgi:hypothetical protein